MLTRDTLSEQLVIGMMLNFDEAVSQGISLLREEHFSTVEYRLVFRAIHNLSKKEQKIDQYSVKGELASFGNPLSLEDISNISDEFYFPEKFNSLVTILEDRRCRRETLDRLKEVSTKLLNSPEPFLDISKEIYSIPEEFGLVDQTIIKPGEEYLSFREKMAESQENKLLIHSGYDDLDELLTFKFAEGEISIIAARPQNGKSTLKTNLIRNMCSMGIGVGSYALEQTLEVESFRLDALMTNLSLKDEIIKQHKWLKSDPRWEKLRSAWKIQSEWNYYLIEGTGKTWAQIKNELKALSKNGVKIFFFDLFDRMKEIGEAKLNTHAAIKSIMNQALETAKALKIHLCLLVQIGRDTIKKKKDPYPRLVDLKESGSYEEFARLVLLLHYPKSYDYSLINSPIHLYVAKQSNGPLAELVFPFQEQTFNIVNKTIKPLNMKNDSAK